MKHQKEIQALILDSQRVEKHAPIEEDIDNLLHEDELEELDNEIEFEFEIDKSIVGDNDDMSMFDREGHHKNYHEKEENHHESNHHEVSDTSNKHFNEEQHQNKPLHEIIHEKINELTEIQQTETTNIEKNDDDEVSSDNIFSNDDRINYVQVDDESELPLEEEKEEVVSTENVNEIRAVLSNKQQDKEEKKERIKKYLQQIAAIPDEENSIVTETYADLLAKQGKIERSIKMYQQLILNNPQKKVYFAAKIKQLIKNI